MTVVKANFTVPYEAFPDGTKMHKPDSLAFGTVRECKVIKHEIKVLVRYLIEYEDGTRRWSYESVKRKRNEHFMMAARVRDDDEDEDEDEDEGEGEWRGG